MVSHFAVVGAALTWAGRMMLDAIFLWVAYSMYLPNVLVKKYTK
jgi:hypothetical protein